MLLARHRIDGQWKETMAAVQPMLFAEAHRDETKQKRPYTLEEFTLTGMAKATRKAIRAQKEAEARRTPEAVWAKIGGLMRVCGGS